MRRTARRTRHRRLRLERRCGIQADIKTVAAHGLFAETAVTALTAQNTMGVRNVLEATPTFIAEQIDAIFEDIPPAAIKIGMCPSAPAIEAVADALTRWSAANIVLDPVMVATSGARLIAEDAVHALEDRLMPLARLITPNMPEAEVLAGFEVRDEKDQERAAVALADRFGLRRARQRGPRRPRCQRRAGPATD